MRHSQLPQQIRAIARRWKSNRRLQLGGLPCCKRKFKGRMQRIERLLSQWLDQTPLEKAVRNAAVMPEKSRNQLRIADLSSLDAITHGKGTMRDLRMLIDAGNIAQCLVCDFNIGGEEVKEAIAKAEMAILQCAARFERTKRFGFTGEELAAMREMLEWAHAQREVAARSTYMKAINLLAARVKAGHNTIDLEAACAAINGREVVA